MYPTSDCRNRISVLANGDGCERNTCDCNILLTEKLYEHCAEIEAAAQHRMDVILPQLIKHYGVTEQLKAENQLEWVRQMNACVAQAEETIKGELIYAD